MKLTQADYDGRKQRQADGVASDDDRRLIKLYEGEGYVWSRLQREAEAKAAARDARAGLATDELLEDGQGEQHGPELPKVTQRDKHEDWIKFANAVNARLEPGERPIEDPDSATKTALSEAYKHWATGAGAPTGE